MAFKTSLKIRLARKKRYQENELFQDEQSQITKDGNVLDTFEKWQTQLKKIFQLI